MLGSAKIGTVAFVLALGPVGIAADDSMEAVPGPAFRAAAVESVTSCDLTQTPQTPQAQPRARRGVLGWLYKYTRNIDVERAGSQRMPGFLRSPLLGALPDRSGEDCDKRAQREVESVVTCAVISLNSDRDKSIVFTAPMPQLGEVTLSGIEDAIRERLSRGEKVTLETSQGKQIRLRHDDGKYVNARTCRSDA